jgi:mRNA interferase MazF
LVTSVAGLPTKSSLPASMPFDVSNDDSRRPATPSWLPLTRSIVLRFGRFEPIWMLCVRGEVYQFVARGEGHGQRGPRFAVVLQPGYLALSTLLIAPTSASARPTLFRPQVRVMNRKTVVLCEQTTAVDAERLTKAVGFLTVQEMQEVDDALRLVLDL